MIIDLESDHPQEENLKKIKVFQSPQKQICDLISNFFYTKRKLL